jgi:hypothetical protein
LDPTHGGPRARAGDPVNDMEKNDATIRDADLELLLAESDREEPFLVVPRSERQEPREEIDEQILAGLVTPY